MPVLDGFPVAQLNGLKADLLLSDSGLTLSWLLETLWEHCPEFVVALGHGKVHEVSAKDISEGKGFVSKVYKTVLKLTDAQVESFTVMMKVPTTECLDKMLKEVCEDEKNQDVNNLVDVAGAHNVECKVYDFFKDSTVLPLPKVWYTQQASKETIGVILMEDLSVDAVCLGVMASVTLQQIKNCNKHFATFHKHLLCMSETETKRWEAIPSTRDMHVDDYPNALQIDLINKIPEYKEGEFKELMDKIKPVISNDFARYALLERPKELGVPLLLCHGDTGAHNMFFKKASDGTASNEVSAFHDWQIVCKGNAMIDIARIMYGFADPEVRREAEATIVEDYYEHLKEGMAREGRVLDVTIEQMRESYALAAIHQAAEMGLLFPGFIESMNKDDFAPNVLEAWREKTLLRAKLTLRDTIENLQKYAPQFLAE